MVGNKIVLVQPETKEGSSLGIRKSPSSIQHLGGQLQKEGFMVFMKHEPVTEGLVRSIIETGAKTVGISTMTSNFREGEKLAHLLKLIDPTLTIIIGGWHASGCAKAHLLGRESESIQEILGSTTPFDMMVFGEGELVLPEILRRLGSGSEFDLPGVGFFRNNQIIINLPVSVPLDSVADPLWDGIDISRYRDLRSGALDLSIHTQRGCSWGCSYCSTQTVSGKKLRSLSVDRVISQLIEIAEKFRPQVITFTNEDPLIDLSYFRKIIKQLIDLGFQQKYGIQIDIFASVVDIFRMMSNTKYQGIIQEMKEAGVSSFTIGVESFNPIILRKYNKLPMILATMSPTERSRFLSLDETVQNRVLLSHYLRLVQSSIGFSQKHGILCVGDYMIGNPGEKASEVAKGFALFSALNGMHVAYIPSFTPFPGTGVWPECYPKVVRVDGKIAWELFDASHVSYDSGIQPELRGKLEVDFYTSDRYLRDMHTAIKSGLLPTQFFKNRFEFMLRKFGNSDSLEKAIRELDQS